MNTKKTAKVALATFGLSVLLPTAAMAASDTQGHWAGSVLEKWESQALLSGYEDGTIRPDQEISRAEFVALVNRVAGYQSAGSAVNFSDVQNGDWYAGQVSAAVNQGYIAGFEDGTFRPNDSVTRAQAAAIIACIQNLAADQARTEQFADAAQVPDWAKGVVGAVANAGYMIGDETNCFRAEKALTRAEAVASLDRVFGVKDLAAQTITLSATEGVITKGSTKTVTVTSSVEGAVITAASSDEAVATVTVKDGKLTIKGVDKGTATITVAAKADGYKTGTATYAVTVTAAAGGGGGGSSSSGGSSNIYATVTPNVILPEGVKKDDIVIKTTVYKDDAAQDATTVADLPEGVEVASVTLPAGSEFSASGVKVVLKSEIERTTAGVITGGDVKKAINMEELGATAQQKLNALSDDRVLIECTQNGNTLSWVIDGMTPAEQKAVFAQLEVELKVK